mgnify:CR=1 FL=1
MASRWARDVVLVRVGVMPMARRRESARESCRPAGQTPKTRTDSDDPAVSTCALAQVSLGCSATHSAHRRTTVAADDAGKLSEKKPIDVAGMVR